MSNIKIIFIGFIFAVYTFLCVFAGWNFHKPVETIRTITKDSLITVISNKVIPKFIHLFKYDTLKIDNIIHDTLRIHESYLATVDTAYADSDLVAHISYISDIPLSRNSYFNLNFLVRHDLEAFTRVENKYRVFDYGITAGIGYGIFTNRPDIFVGFGLSIHL